MFDRCREVQAEPDGFVDLWARGHYKSTVITFALTIQDILNDPELTFGIFSFSRPIAKQFLRQIKTEFETNALLKWAFDDILFESPVGQAPKWSEDDGIIVKRNGNPKESTVEAWGLVDGMPTSKHFKRLVYDDVVTDKSVTTPEQIKKTTAAWGLSRSLVSAESASRVIGTRYHYFDSYADIMTRGFKVRKYAATKCGTAAGEPWLMSREKLADKMIEMQEQFAPQMMQEPRLAKDAFFKPDWWKRWTTRPKVVNYYIGCDFAETAGSGDYTVFVVVAVDENEDIYVVDVYRQRVDTLAWAKELIGLCQIYDPMAVGVPNDNIWKGSKPFLETLFRETNCYPHIVELPDAGDKIQKAKSAQGLAAHGRIFLPAATLVEQYTPPAWLPDLESEILMFPMGKNDDQVDGLSAIGRLLREISGGSVSVPEKKPDMNQEYGTSIDRTYDVDSDPMLA